MKSSVIRLFPRETQEMGWDPVSSLPNRHKSHFLFLSHFFSFLRRMFQIKHICNVVVRLLYLSTPSHLEFWILFRQKAAFGKWGTHIEWVKLDFLLWFLPHILFFSYAYLDNSLAIFFKFKNSNIYANKLNK